MKHYTKYLAVFMVFVFMITCVSSSIAPVLPIWKDFYTPDGKSINNVSISIQEQYAILSNYYHSAMSSSDNGLKSNKITLLGDAGDHIIVGLLNPQDRHLKKDILSIPEIDSKALYFVGFKADNTWRF